MSSKFKNYWKKAKVFTESMPDLLNPQFKNEFLDLKEGETYIGKINNKLLQYEEIKYVCKKTRIKPFYYLLFIIISLSFILIGYFDKYLTLILATIYPLFMTFKTLQNYNEKEKQNKIEVIHWLKYWVFYTVFLIFESLFGYFFRRFYFIFKIIFLLSCFPVNSRLTTWIYNTCLRIVRKYEKIIVDFFKNIHEHLIDSKKEFEKIKKKLKKDDDTDNYGEKLGNYIKSGKDVYNLYKNIY